MMKSTVIKQNAHFVRTTLYNNVKNIPGKERERDRKVEKRV